MSRHTLVCEHPRHGDAPPVIGFYDGQYDRMQLGAGAFRCMDCVHLEDQPNQVLVVQIKRRFRRKPKFVRVDA
jgi:hypothetical protein